MGAGDTAGAGPQVPLDLVEAARAASRRLGRAVADVSVEAIAAEAGISRRTLIRRLGGSRRALDDAVRAAGTDPGGRPPVRERAIEAGARLLGEHGLAALTLEAVAADAECSVPSLHAVFAGRDGLLLAVYERFWPVVDIEAFLASPDAGDDLAATVRGVCRLLGASFQRRPRVLPAILAEILTRPGSAPVQSLMAQFLPRLLDGVGGWIAAEVRRGRIRDLPLSLLLQQLVGPILLHSLSRPVDETLAVLDLPGPEEAYDVLAACFLGAVGTGSSPP